MIKTIAIDYEKKKLSINGKDITDIPVIVSLPHSNGWSREVMINEDKISGMSVARISVKAEGLKISD